jgi:outer membrane protein
LTDTNQSEPVVSDQANVNITLNQPLFRGFKTTEGTKVAEAEVKAGRQQLLGVEQQVLFNAVQAYANVLRDRQILALRQKNVGFLQKQLDASNARFKAGELTRTDVAQSRASLSGARGSVAVATANSKSSEANYLAIVGRRPGKLASAKLAKRPSSLDYALQVAQETNPNILAAAYAEDAAEHNIEVIKGDLLPTISLQGQLNHNYDSSRGGSGFFGSSNPDVVETAQVEGILAIPLYDGGRIYSGVRQAKQTASQNRIQVIGAVRTVRENVANAWNNLTATGQSLAATADQVSAAVLALDGVQQEYLVGSRTTIDVLNAQQAVLSAQISQVSARHDQLVASYQLQAAMGHLTSRNLGIGGRYDPTDHYDKVRNKWIGLSAETVE